MYRRQLLVLLLKNVLLLLKVKVATKVAARLDSVGTGF